MHARGAADRVSLTDCSATPSGHLACVAPFLTFTLGQLATQAQNL